MIFKNLIVNKGKLISKGSVGFVITENCSFKCKHCLRGDRRPNTITKEVIDLVLSQVNINGELFLTGGEPLLAIDKVTYLLNRLHFYGSNPKSLLIVTNGSVSPRKFEKFAAAVPDGIKLKLRVSNDF